jgi:hypothetical protein
MDAAKMLVWLLCTQKGRGLRTLLPRLEGKSFKTICSTVTQWMKALAIHFKTNALYVLATYQEG